MKTLEVVYGSKQYYCLHKNWITWEFKKDYWGRKIAVMVRCKYL